MPKNIKGGKKAKSLKNSSGETKHRDIPFPEESDDSHVAIITAVNGDGRYLCQIINIDGLQPQVYPVNLSRGVKQKHAKGIIIVKGTYVLMAIREFQKDKGDIIFVYRDSEISHLVDDNYICIINVSNEDNNDDGVIFADDINDDNEINKIIEDI